MTPTVSIITPLFNKGRFIAETAESVVEQTHREFEWIVVDNRSTDDGVETVRSLADPRVVIASHEASQGPGATRNAGLEMARGEWVLFLDADDLISPTHLKDLLEMTNAFSDPVDLVAGPWIEKNATCSDRGLRKEPPSIGQLRASAIAAAPWAVHAALIRHEKTPRWPEHLDQLPGEDIAYWFSAIRQCEVAYLWPEIPGAIYRTGTDENRTGIEGDDRWYRGVDAAIEENVRSSEELAAAECETLVRVYINLYGQARQRGQRTIANDALSKARHWFQHRASMPDRLSLAMRIRLLLGPRWFYFFFRR